MLKYLKLFEDFNYMDVDMYNTGALGNFQRFKNENPSLELEEEFSNDIKSFETYLEKKYDIDLYLHYSKITKILSIDKIVVNKENRNIGIGTNVMNEICSYADENDIILALTPSKDFGGSIIRLKEFYKRFNFKKNDNFLTKQTLIRYPKNN